MRRARGPTGTVVLLARCCAAAGLAIALAGCKIIAASQVAALRQHREGSFDPHGYVQQNWATRAVPTLQREAVGLPALVAAARRSPAQLEAMGRRAGEGSPLTVVVRGEGMVRALDRSGPKGRVEIDTGTVPVAIQAGPLVFGTALRDALPFVNFDDVPDQIAFARLGAGITERALAPLRPMLARLRPGDRVRFVGAAPWRGADTTLIVTPLQVEVTR